MLKKELLGINGEFDGIARLKIGVWGRRNYRKYGYMKDEGGDLVPNKMNGIEILSLYVTLGQIKATVPFIYKGVLYNEGDSSFEPETEWQGLVGGVVDVKLVLGE